jgi:hypothetical protein
MKFITHLFILLLSSFALAKESICTIIFIFVPFLIRLTVNISSGHCIVDFRVHTV